MTMKEARNLLFVGSAREVVGGKRWKVMIHREKLGVMKQYLEQPGNGDFVFLVMERRRGARSEKWTHWLAIDTWKPEKKPVEESGDPVEEGWQDDGF